MRVYRFELTPHFLKGISNVFAGFFIMLFDSSIDESTAFMILPCEILTMTVLFPFGSWLAKRIDGRIQLSIGCVIGLSTALASSYCTNFWAFFVLYAGGFGVCNGFAYVVPVYSGWRYFKDNKGLVTGIVLCGFGFGAFFFNLISTAVVNPKGLDSKDGLFPAEVANNVPKMIRVLTICWACISAISILLFFPYQEPPKQQQAISRGVTMDDEKLENLKRKQLNQRKRFPKVKQLLANVFVQSIMGYFVINTFKSFGQKHINDDKFLTIVGSVSSVFGGLRFIWSYFVDFTNTFRKPYFILLCVQLIFGSTLVLVSNIESLFFIWVCIIVWCEGGHFSLVPTAVARMFGEHAPIVYGFAFSFGSIPQIISSIMVKFYLKDIGYDAFYYASAAATLISLIILIFFFEEKKVC
ncbi:major facilitator superfamily protein [Stylonychia lemnae]|uniref:Major facilitator superfamily protein n=1 Tax=Stylonychia lemnae TaxID=5949 RepID=A0A078B0K7_STYLE|nr:major facilitator superfamily protein [Stylonychia lemnae]|eukprot:CDW86897.1 major facilitator superfamily protein [Stylonychia lemnae]